MFMTVKKALMIGALAFILVFGALIAFGAWSVWYRNTGYQEQFQLAPKPQKAIYFKTPKESIVTTGLEPDTSTRTKARWLVNPVAPVGESISAGKELYLIYCAPCHGIDGDGLGIMGAVPYLGKAPDYESQALAQYLSGYLGYSPRVNLNFIQEESDGEIFYTITNGGEAIMPAFRDALTPQQRWDLINYIKRGLGGRFGG